MPETLKELFLGVTTSPSEDDLRSLATARIYFQLGDFYDRYPEGFVRRLSGYTPNHDGVPGRLFLLPNAMSLAEINSYNQFPDDPKREVFAAYRLGLTELGDDQPFFVAQFNPARVRPDESLEGVKGSQLKVITYALEQAVPVDPSVAARYRALRYPQSFQ